MKKKQSYSYNFVQKNEIAGYLKNYTNSLTGMTDEEARLFVNEKVFNVSDNMNVSKFVLNRKTNDYDKITINKDNYKIAFLDQFWSQCSFKEKAQICNFAIKCICNENGIESPTVSFLYLRYIKKNYDTIDYASFNFQTNNLVLNSMLLTNKECDGLFVYSSLVHELQHYIDNLLINKKISFNNSLPMLQNNSEKLQLTPKESVCYCSELFDDILSLRKPAPNRKIKDMIYNIFEVLYQYNRLEARAYFSQNKAIENLAKEENIKNYIKRIDLKTISYTLDAYNMDQEVIAIMKTDPLFNKLHDLSLKVNNAFFDLCTHFDDYDILDAKVLHQSSKENHDLVDDYLDTLILYAKKECKKSMSEYSQIDLTNEINEEHVLTL